jgi:hypothetical protein
LLVSQAEAVVVSAPPVSDASAGNDGAKKKMIGAANFNEKMKQKKYYIHDVPHSHTIITQIILKMLRSHMTTKSRRETKDVTSNLKNKLVLD